MKGLSFDKCQRVIGTLASKVHVLYIFFFGTFWSLTLFYFFRTFFHDWLYDFVILARTGAISFIFVVFDSGVFHFFCVCVVCIIEFLIVVLVFSTLFSKVLTITLACFF